ncbi:MAG: hypothetical protein ACI4VQ_06270 [Clostridia bacterium]
MKENIKWFEKNKLDFLERIMSVISVGNPALGCDLNQLIKENDKRMNAAAWVLYNYINLEANIKNYKEYSKPSNYDKETIESIKESFEYNKSQFEIAWENMLKLDLR